MKHISIAVVAGLLACFQLSGCMMKDKAHATPAQQNELSASLQNEFDCLKGTEVALALPTPASSPSSSPSPALPGGAFAQDPSQATLLATLATPTQAWVNQAFFLFNAETAYVVLPPETANRMQIAGVEFPGISDLLLIQVIRTSQPPSIAVGSIFQSGSAPANFTVVASAISVDQARPGIVTTVAAQLATLRDRVTASPDLYKNENLTPTLDACAQVKSVSYTSNATSVFVDPAPIAAQIRSALGF